MPGPRRSSRRCWSGRLQLVRTADAVILSDYAKGALSPQLCQAVIALARERSIPVLVDPKDRDFSKYAGATTICPNLQELGLATGIDRHNLAELLAAAQQLVFRLGIDYMTVTMSEKGIRLLYPDSVFHSPTRAREVFDVTGAGDTVVATLAASLAGGLDAETAVNLANIAAGIVVAKTGTAPISRNELVAEFTASTQMKGPDKILDLQHLLVRLAEWRANGDRIVFTNGCFDILHVGHITLLEQCREFGDKIVIGVNSDASVKRLKGPTRPVVGEKERARILAALGSTDAVIIFDEPTPLELIRNLRPDVLVKGGDYTTSTIVGADDVVTWGGRVEIVPTVDGASTTNTIRKMSANTSHSVRKRPFTSVRLRSIWSCRYWFLKVSMGSMLAARRAGINAANIANNKVITGTVQNVSGSSALIPNKKLRKNLVSKAAVTKPATDPAVARNRLCFTMSLTISQRIAPSARRMPISRVRQLTT